MKRAAAMAVVLVLLTGCVQAGGGLGQSSSEEKEEARRAADLAMDPCALVPEGVVQRLLGRPPEESPRPTAPSVGPSGVGFRYCVWRAAGAPTTITIGAAVAPVIPAAFDAAVAAAASRPGTVAPLVPNVEKLGFDAGGVRTSPAGAVLFVRIRTLAFALKVEGFADGEEAMIAVGAALREQLAGPQPQSSGRLQRKDGDDSDPAPVSPVDPCALLDAEEVATTLGLSVDEGVATEALVVPLGQKVVEALACHFPVPGNPETGVFVRVAGDRAGTIRKAIRAFTTPVEGELPHGASARWQNDGSAMWARFGAYTVVIQIVVPSDARVAAVPAKAFSLAVRIVTALAEREP